MHKFPVPDMLQMKGGGNPKYLQNLAAFDRALVWLQTWAPAIHLYISRAYNISGVTIIL